MAHNASGPRASLEGREAGAGQRQTCPAAPPEGAPVSRPPEEDPAAQMNGQLQQLQERGRASLIKEKMGLAVATGGTENETRPRHAAASWEG